MTKPTAPQAEAAMRNELEAMTDDELRAIVAEAEALLARRENERRKAALSQIRAIAKAHGMSVSVEDKGKRAVRARRTS